MTARVQSTAPGVDDFSLFFTAPDAVVHDDEADSVVGTEEKIRGDVGTDMIVA